MGHLYSTSILQRQLHTLVCLLGNKRLTSTSKILSHLPEAAAPLINLSHQHPSSYLCEQIHISYCINTLTTVFNLCYLSNHFYLIDLLSIQFFYLSLSLSLILRVLSYRYLLPTISTKFNVERHYRNLCQSSLYKASNDSAPKNSTYIALQIPY